LKRKVRIENENYYFEKLLAQQVKQQEGTSRAA
jgi:hypothetical protein